MGFFPLTGLFSPQRFFLSSSVPDRSPLLTRSLAESHSTMNTLHLLITGNYRPATQWALHTRITTCHCSAAAEPLAFPILLSIIKIQYHHIILDLIRVALCSPGARVSTSVRTTHHGPTPIGFQPYWKASKAGLKLVRMVRQSNTSRAWQCLRHEGRPLSATYFTLMLWTTQDVSNKVRSKFPCIWIYTRFAPVVFGRYSGRPVSPSSSHSLHNIITIFSQLPMHSPAVLHPPSDAKFVRWSMRPEPI